MIKTNKNLFTIAENIAAKEIDRDPIDYIRRESVFHDNIKLNMSIEENKGLDVVEEEIHSEEDVNKATFTTNNVQLPSKNNYDDTGSDDNDNHVQLNTELEEVFYDAYDFIPTNSLKSKSK